MTFGNMDVLNCFLDDSQSSNLETLSNSVLIPSHHYISLHTTQDMEKRALQAQLLAAGSTCLPR